MKTSLQLAESQVPRADSRSLRRVSLSRRFALSALSSPLSAFLFLLFLAPAARAQWQTTTYTLHGGWNSLYLHGDATHATIETLLAANPEVINIWRWNPNTNPIQFGSSPLIPTAGTAEWSVWVKGQPTQTTLASLNGQTAYLVECTGTIGSTYSLSIPQKVIPPRSTWVRNGANFLGFPAKLTAGAYPTFSAYFATFPVATASNTKIYKYVGGPLGPDNPTQVYAPTFEALDRTQAYWFDAAVVGDFYAPLEVSPSNLSGLIYGRTGNQITVRVRNRTAAVVTLNVAPVTSASAPDGQEAITAAVPLTRRVFNSTTQAYDDVAVTSLFTVAIGPQASVELSFGLDRSLMTGATDALYASLLRFTESANLMDVVLPVSARVSSLAGLWVGDVAVTNVSNRTPARYYTCLVTRTGGATVPSVVSRGVQSGATTLGPATLPAGSGGTLTYQWQKSGEPIAGATSANLTLTATEITESGAFGSAVPRSYPLRVILHVANDGTARLLSQVFLGRLAPAPYAFGLCTKEEFLKPDDKANARRLVAAHLPLDTDLSSGSGSVALGSTLVRSFTVGFNERTNPYVHTYHPDHDNKDARFAPLTTSLESPDISRVCSFAFALTPPAGTSGWGSTVLGGTYSETVSGLHRDSLTVLGTFELRRVSEIGSITTN
jgi:hypothetical protein